MAFLIEHYAGKFPLWLAPVQIKILPIADRHIEYAQSVTKQLAEAGYRVEVDDSKESVGKKIRAAQEVDVAVSEQCRNLSVYLQLVAQLKEQIDRQGILLSYGVSNSNTADIARILWGKTDLAVVPRFVRVMKYNQALEKKVGSAFVSDFLSVIANPV